VAVHRDDIRRYPGTLAELAGELGDLRYDALAAFLHALGDKLAADAAADAARGRPSLAAELTGGAAGLKAAAARIERAWAISAPHM
jgi:hypothetical protein